MPTNTSPQPPHPLALLHQADDDAPRPPELDTLASAQSRRAWRSIETAAERVATGSRLQG